MFVWIPGGTFHFGCEPGDSSCFKDEKPGRTAEVKGFWLGQTDVTVDAYGKCVAAGACTAASTGGACNWKVAGTGRHPVNCITWEQAAAVCAWLGGRLPTAEEWEYAAKGGESRIFPWGSAPLSGTRANFCDRKCRNKHPEFTWFDATQDDGWETTSPVGTYPAGASKQGLLDMAGDVSQWTSSDYDQDDKEARGGSWDLYARYLRTSARISLRPGRWFDNVGVRCARDR